MSWRSLYKTKYKPTPAVKVQLHIINWDFIMKTINVKKQCISKPMCLFCMGKTCLMDIATPKNKWADNAWVQMAPYIIRHFIIQSYARASKLVGFNIVTNMPGCVLIKIRQNFSNNVVFYTNCRFNIKGNEQPILEVLLIESETAMRCIRKNAVEGQFDSNIYYQLYNSCNLVNAISQRQ
jgi:hypothetical protein